MLNAKQQKMNTIETLIEKQNELKIQLKMAQSAKTVVDCFIDRDEFTFESNLFGSQSLFINNKLLSCGKLNIKSRDLKFHDSVHESEEGRKITTAKFLSLKKAVKFIENNIDQNGIMREVFAENNVRIIDSL